VIFYALFIILINLKGPKLTCLLSQASCWVGKASHRWWYKFGSRGGGCKHATRALSWWDLSLGAQLCSAEDYPVLSRGTIVMRIRPPLFVFTLGWGLPFSPSSTAVGLVQTSGISWSWRKPKTQKERLDPPCKASSTTTHMSLYSVLN